MYIMYIKCGSEKYSFHNQINGDLQDSRNTEVSASDAISIKSNDFCALCADLGEKVYKLCDGSTVGNSNVCPTALLLISNSE